MLLLRSLALILILSLPAYAAGQATTIPPGDCNADQSVDAGDIAALVLELFDDDGDFPAAVTGGSFPGHPQGCNPNHDDLVDAGDISCAALLIFDGDAACAIPPDRPNSGSPLGTNLTDISDWSTEWTFVDAFKASRPWISGDATHWDDGRPLDLDERGWVRSLLDGQVARTLLLLDQAGHYPTGQYVVLYDGEGSISYGFDAAKNDAASAPGRDVLDVTPGDNGIYLVITETDPGGTSDYIRNIRVIMPGFEDSYETQIFHPAFLKKIERYKVLRFMDWMRTNGSGQGQWSQRPQVNDARYSTAAGVPLEIMVDLANRQRADPWFTIPHLATDDYLTRFAAQVRDTLHPDLSVTVEYSNEIWNGGFSQGNWVEQQGEAMWPDAAASGYTKRINWHGLRTAQMCDIWKTTWGEQSDRVICVAASQSANSWTGSTALTCPLWDEGPCLEHGIDALAIAPYFGHYLGLPGVESQVEAWTGDSAGGLDKLFQELTSGGLLSNSPAGGALQAAYDDMAANKTVADNFGIDLLAYEGGQHLVGVWGVENNDNITDLFQNANRDKRMGDLYASYLAEWQRQGGGMFAHFVNVGQASKWGSWGALEYLDQPGSPKFDALMAVIES